MMLGVTQNTEENAVFVHTKSNIFHDHILPVLQLMLSPSHSQSVSDETVRWLFMIILYYFYIFQGGIRSYDNDASIILHKVFDAIIQRINISNTSNILKRQKCQFYFEKWSIHDHLKRFIQDNNMKQYTKDTYKSLVGLSIY